MLRCFGQPKAFLGYLIFDLSNIGDSLSNMFEQLHHAFDMLYQACKCGRLDGEYTYCRCNNKSKRKF